MGMIRSIICENQTEFDAISEAIQNGLIADVEGYSASKWTDEIIHPIEGTVALMIEARALPYLTETQQSRIETLSEDWFE